MNRAPMVNSPSLSGDALRAYANPFGNGFAGGDLDAIPGQARPGAIKQGANRRVRTGLMPAQAGTTHGLLIKRKVIGEAVTAERLRELRAAAARADRKTRELEQQILDLPVSTDADEIRKLNKSYLQALDEATAAKKLLDLATQRGAVGRNAKELVLCVAQDPSSVPEAFLDAEKRPVVICLHHGCRGEEFPSIAALKGAHPTEQSMAARGEAHVFAWWSNAPADASDPDGAVIGLIAPRGADGSTARTVAEGDAPELE